MSLHEAAEGLLETHVTWQDVEAEMQKALQTPAQFGANRKVTCISDLKGFMSKVALIEPDWTGFGVTGTEELPNKFVVKIPSQLPTLKLSEYGFETAQIKAATSVTRLHHNREVRVYESLLRMRNSKIPITQIYGMKSFDNDSSLKAFIISEYIPNIEFVGMHESIPSKDLLNFVKTMGAFSAVGEVLIEKGEDLSFVGGPDMVAKTINNFYNRKVNATVESICENMKKLLPAEYIAKVEAVNHLLLNVYTRPQFLEKLTDCSKYVGGRNVLCHCDCLSGNFLFNKNKDDGGRLELKAVIDWQTTSICNPAVEITRILLALGTQESRSSERDFFLESYYNAMVEELGGRTASYTREQLLDSHHLHLPTLTLLVIPGALKYLEPQFDITERGVALEKMLSVVDNIIESHQYNMEHYPNFFEF